MKARPTITLCLLALAVAGQAQNQIITPTGKPLVIGNQGGVKFSHLNANSPTQASNGKVLSVNDSGLLMLVPESTGSASQWTSNGPTLHYVTGNVGIGTATPLQRLDVNGSINMPVEGGLRFGNVTFLRTTGNGNIFLGPNPTLEPTGGANNVFVGASAGSATVSSSDNVFVGGQAGMANTSPNGNVFVGAAAGRANTSGPYNTFLGSYAGFSNTTSGYNTFLGYNAGYQNTSGNQNLFAGVSAGYSNTTGSLNLFLGSHAGRVNTTAVGNSFIGVNSGINTSVGGNNTFVGVNAGAANTSGNANTLVGANSYLGSGTLFLATAIGAGAVVNQNNSLVLGNPTVSVGIGNSAPTARLHLTAGGTTATGVRLENLPSKSGTVFLLYVDANGNVMKGSSATNLREAAGESSDVNWTLTPDNHLLNANAGGVLIGTGLSATPAGYKLYVSDGILTERVKVAVKSTADWRDYVLRDDYKLRPVEEVASYIRANKHLPGVPSAQQMVEQGNDLHQTDALLLEKIEEMMLYIIDLKQENTVLKEATEQSSKVKAELVEYQSTVRSLLERVEALEKK